jgi:hypothetical protein
MQVIWQNYNCFDLEGMSLVYDSHDRSQALDLIDEQSVPAPLG